MALTTSFPRASDAFIARPQSDYIEGRALAANTAERVAIPSGARYVVFASNDNFCAKLGDGTVTAAWPTDTSDGSASELNPSSFAIAVSGQTHVSVITANNAVMTLSFYL